MNLPAIADRTWIGTKYTIQIDAKGHFMFLKGWTLLRVVVLIKFNVLLPPVQRQTNQVVMLGVQELCLVPWKAIWR